MEYRQLRQPNLDPIVYNRGKLLTDWYGMCLATVETAFDTPRLYPNAWTAWNENPDRHQDRNWPRNVYFVIFFTGAGGDGHIAIAFVDSNGNMKIWTSPYTHVPTFYTGYTSVDALARGYGITYMGWSPSLAGVQLIAPVEQTPAPIMINTDQLYQLFRDILQRDPDVGAIQHYVGHFTYDFVHTDLLNSAEYHQLQANIAAAQAAQAQAAAEAAAAAEKAAQEAQQSSNVPSAPATVPTSTTPLPIKTTVMTYGSLTDAVNRTNSKGEIFSGSIWYIYCEKSGMLNITQTPGTTSGTWINPSDNEPAPPTPDPVVTPAPAEPEPTPEPAPAPKVETQDDIRASFQPMMPDGSPVDCDVLVTSLVIDVFGYGEPINAKKDRSVKVYGTFIAGGHVFAAVGMKNKNIADGYMYGMTIAARDNFKPYLSDPYSLNDHIRKSWELLYDKLVPTIEGIFRAFKKKK
jgi:hypothetical protein